MALDLDALMTRHGCRLAEVRLQSEALSWTQERSSTKPNLDLGALMARHNRRRRPVRKQSALRQVPLFASVQDLPTTKLKLPKEFRFWREKQAIKAIGRSKSSRSLAKQAISIKERVLPLIDRMNDTNENRAAILAEIIVLSNQHADLTLAHEIMVRATYGFSESRAILDIFRLIASSPDRLCGLRADDWRDAEYRFDLADAWGIDWRAFLTIYVRLVRYLPDVEYLELDLRLERQRDERQKQRGVSSADSWSVESTLEQRLDQIRRRYASTLFRLGLDKRNFELFSSGVSNMGGSGFFRTWYRSKNTRGGVFEVYDRFGTKDKFGTKERMLMRLTGAKLRRFIDEWVEAEYAHHDGFTSELVKLRTATGMPLVGD